MPRSIFTACLIAGLALSASAYAQTTMPMSSQAMASASGMSHDTTSGGVMNAASTTKSDDMMKHDHSMKLSTMPPAAALHDTMTSGAMSRG
jgi:hypothetical protein